MSNIVLVPGGGPNTGLNIARVFSSKGSYKTATDLSIQADFTDRKSIKHIFDEVKQKFGVPIVVVYNG
ncbi:hypothetical protein BPOR_0084g00250 [Botrytis porri]|uniref:Uncharacterized protein n=1 Tax=Botrytis porri TaxID=87229 RepID=A0A4Z1KZP5_9HELO|nr:hypothetical protein BPOR_0084g00250 [Botrytis porri]